MIFREDGRDRRTLYLIETSPNINRTCLNDIIHHLGQRRQKVTGRNLGIKKNLRGQKSFISHVDNDLSSSTLVDFHALKTRGIGVVTGEFLDDVRTDIGEFFFDAFGGAE